MTVKIPITVADFEVQLATAISIGATSFTISTVTDDDGITIPNGKYAFTVDNGSSNKEYFMGDLVSTTISNVVSVSRQGAETTGAVRAHRVGASVILTDFTVLQRVGDILRGALTLDAGSPLSYDATATISSANQLATVAYVLSVVTGGTVAFNNQIITGVVAGENLTAGQSVYLKTSDQRWYKTDATDTTKSEGVKLGIALTTTTTGNTITAGVQLLGIYTTSGLTAGAKYYLSNTGGALVATTPGTFSVFFGWALSTTVLLISPREIQIPTATQLTGFVPSGSIFSYVGYTAPTNYLLCDGTAVSRTTFSSLFSAICPSATFTVTIASPGVFTATAHGLHVGDKIHLTTTGALPTGLAANTDYFVISAGLTANAFEVALSPGGPAINTSGTQSGVHTFYFSNFGKGDGSTTFNVPDLRGRKLAMIGNFVKTLTFEGDSSVVNTGADTIAVAAECGLYQGQPVVLTGAAVPTGLTTATTYYVIRASNVATTIKLASSQALADAGTAIDITATGSGINTFTYTAPTTTTILGRSGGEEQHGLALSEMAAHTHSYTSPGAGAQGVDGAPGAGGIAATTGSAGGDTQHNNLSPFITVNYIIKT